MITSIRDFRNSVNESAEQLEGFSIDIEQATIDNTNYREVLYTAKHSQLVVMCIEPEDEIGEETHHSNDQFIRIEAGEGMAVIDGRETELKNGTAIVVPAGAKHNIVNTSTDTQLKLYTIYSPPHHPEGTIHKTKGDGDNDIDDIQMDREQE